MRTIGVIMILVGGGLAVVNGNYMFRDERESRDFQARHAQWMDEKGSYYPRPVRWYDEEISWKTVSDFSPLLFIGGCVLFGAGAITAQQRKQHILTCKWLQDISKKSSKAPVTKVKESDGKEDSSEKHRTPPRTSESKRSQQNHLVSAPNQIETAEVLPEASVVPAKGHPQQSAPTQTEKLVELVPHGLPVSSQRARAPLSPWWPASPTGISLFCILLVVAFFASIAVTGEPISGIVSAGLWYLIIIFVRYLVVVAPTRK